MQRFFGKSIGGLARATGALFLVLFVGAVVANGERLKRFSLTVDVFEPDASHLFYASDVPVSILELAAKLPPEQLGRETYPTIYKMPLHENLYLAATSRNEDSESEYVLLRAENDRLTEIGRSPKIENVIVNTTFFIGRKAVFIVADVAVPPDFDGLAIFELRSDQLKHLGNLSVGEKVLSTGLHGDFASPAAEATATLKSNVFHISFRGNLYSDWGDGEASEVKLKSPAKYFYNGRGFQKLVRRTKR